MEKLKDPLQKLESHTRFTKQIQQRFKQLLHAKKEEIMKSERLDEKELANSIKDSKQFFKYFRNNK